MNLCLCCVMFVFRKGHFQLKHTVGAQLNFKKSGISKGAHHKKIMWNFHGSLFLTLTFPPKGCHTILQNAQE